MTLLSTNECQGQTAPNHAKTLTFRSISIVGWSESSLVSSRNQSSQVKAFPAMKQASTSSESSMPTVPRMKRASVIAKTRKDSRSTYFRSSAQWRASFASHPTSAPVFREEERQEEERVPETVIGTRLSNDDLLEFRRNVFVCKLSFDNTVRKHWVCRRHAAPHGKREQEVDVRHHSPYQQGRTYSAAGRPQAPAAPLVLVVRSRSGRIQFSACGLKMMPATQVRDQTEDGDEAAEDRADDIEVDHLQFGARVARHARLFLPSSRFPRGTGVCREMEKSWCCGVICMPRMLNLLFGERFLGGSFVLCRTSLVGPMLSHSGRGRGSWPSWAGSCECYRTDGMVWGLFVLVNVGIRHFGHSVTGQPRHQKWGGDGNQPGLLLGGAVATRFPRGRGAQWRQCPPNTNLGVYPSPAVHLTSPPTTSRRAVPCCTYRRLQIAAIHKAVSSPKPGQHGYAIDPTRHYGLRVNILGESAA
ncbi:hypothetical protein KC367_g157 [Hortaea werneckii]|nr:hypothetical protein KC367_g157 [Hortaea werneckii]